MRTGLLLPSLELESEQEGVARLHREAADVLGVSTDSVWNWEAGRRRPKGVVQDRVALPRHFPPKQGELPRSPAAAWEPRLLEGCSALLEQGSPRSVAVVVGHTMASAGSTSVR